MNDKFRNSNSGQIVVIIAIAAVPLIASIGMAVEFAQGTQKKAELQAALDSSVLAAVSVSAREKKLGADPVAIAEKNFQSTFPEKVISSSFSFRDGIAYGAAETSIKSSFGALVGVSLVNVSAKSAATSNPQRHPVCFMAMHPFRKHTLELKDSVSVIAPDCNIYGNSDHVDDVVDPHTPENFLIGKTVQAVGYGHHYIQNVRPPLEHAPEILNDPMAGLKYPFPSGCTATSKVVSGSKQKLSPGTYCNGLSFSAAKDVELEAGTYVISGGSLSVVNSSIRGRNVTIVITGSKIPVIWDKAEIELVAPESGPLAGMAILADRVASTSSILATKVDVHGVIYMPNTEFEWINAGDFKPKADWTVWIVDGISWRGSGKININFDIKHKKVPYPGNLLAVIPTVGPGRVRLLK